MSVFKLTVNIDDKVKWDAHTFATAHKMTLSELVEKSLLSYIGTERKSANGKTIKINPGQKK